jgi:structural maintenance of chromosomes protein 5
MPCLRSIFFWFWGHLSRLNTFVKHGHDRGYVEIELKGKIGMPNLVIRHSINLKNHGSQFTLNDMTITGCEINEHIVELNVQVGNLW